MVKFIKPKSKDSGPDISKILKQFHQIDVDTVMKSKMWDMSFITPETPVEEVIGILSSRKHIYLHPLVSSLLSKAYLDQCR